jgi:hypothetical protein
MTIECWVVAGSVIGALVRGLTSRLGPTRS